MVEVLPEFRLLILMMNFNCPRDNVELEMSDDESVSSELEGTSSTCFVIRGATVSIVLS